MAADIGMAIAVFLCLNLSPYGPAQLQEGAFWKYRIAEAEVSMRIVQVSPADAGTLLKVEMSKPGQTGDRVQVMLAPDRRSARVSQDKPGGEGEALHMTIPEFKPGEVWRILGEESVTILKVQPEGTSTPAGHFPNAIKVSFGKGSEPEAALWIAPGVGVLAAGEDGRRDVELVDYGPRMPAPQMPGMQPGQPQGPPMMPMMPGPPGGASSPAVTALDQNTFVVADPVTRTVTVFAVERAAAGKWALLKKAVAPYGPPIQPMPGMRPEPGARPPFQPESPRAIPQTQKQPN
jgi:hypothetical protein